MSRRRARQSDSTSSQCNTREKQQERSSDTEMWNICETSPCMVVWLVFFLPWRTEQGRWLASVAEWIHQGNNHSQELQRFADIPQHFSCQQFWHFIIPPPLLISAASDGFWGFFLLVCMCMLSSNAPSCWPRHPVLRDTGDDICKVSAIQQLGKAKPALWRVDLGAQVLQLQPAQEAWPWKGFLSTDKG